ncbi:MAG: galactokinase family protein [Myxococcales bacterium]|nr:galactokinase [Myxococcota bacterium]MDW8281291.1 galactokinase family protein [Myxococcales bacterium]
MDGLDAGPGFDELFGVPPVVFAEAPGRINLLGEHTDYNGGLALPSPLGLWTRVELRPMPGGQVRAFSTLAGGPVEGALDEPRRRGDWLDYVLGAALVLRKAGHRVGGFAVRIASEVPPGSGLSSSASLLVALLRALRTAYGLPLSDLELAERAQQAEVEFVGAPVGLMDHLVISLGRPGEALLLDLGARRFEAVPLPPGGEMAVLDSGLRHHHADGASYAARRAECERAAALLGVPCLGVLGEGDLPRLSALPPELARRARHVITEDERVLAAVRALRAGHWSALGALLVQGHVSLRDDFAVSLPEIDLLVEMACAEADVLGARLCGGGFGGAVVVATKAGQARQVAEQVVGRYRQSTGRPGAVLWPPGG